MNITALFSIKGGVGRTLLAAHLAESLTRRGLRVLVLELDPQNSSAWYSLGACGGGNVMGVQYTKKECFEQALRHRPAFAIAKRALDGCA